MKAVAVTAIIGMICRNSSLSQLLLTRYDSPVKDAGKTHVHNAKCIGKHTGWCPKCETLVSIKKGCNEHQGEQLLFDRPDPPCAQHNLDKFNLVMATPGNDRAKKDLEEAIRITKKKHERELKYRKPKHKYSPGALKRQDANQQRQNGRLNG